MFYTLDSFHPPAQQPRLIELQVSQQVPLFETEIRICFNRKYFLNMSVSHEFPRHRLLLSFRVGTKSVLQILNILHDTTPDEDRDEIDKQLVLQPHKIDGYRATHMIQDKAQAALVRLLARAGPFPARRAQRRPDRFPARCIHQYYVVGALEAFHDFVDMHFHLDL